MKFTVAVDEVISKRRLYMIEADSIKEAEFKAEMGDNINELDLDNGDVVDRIVILGTIRIADKESIIMKNIFI